MAGRDCGTSARRRRERRLRSAWRHEQLSVAMSLAAATHHSAQPNAAERGLKMGTGASEEEVHETNDALRGLKRPPPGEPSILAEPGPQRSDRSLRHSSGNAPLLVVATLAAAAADGVDAATLAFLTDRALEARRKEGQEEREKEKKEKKEKAKAKKTLRGFSVFSRFQMLRGSAALWSPMKPKLRLHWNVTSPFLRRTSGPSPWVTT